MRRYLLSVFHVARDLLDYLYIPHPYDIPCLLRLTELVWEEHALLQLTLLAIYPLVFYCLYKTGTIVALGRIHPNML